ncbi:hypothetical protein B0O80DRAFT_298794 [Mortierella sp. GBAus27b]|nr:hypothetical protein B0O80DRAFT_298794 [Mortierella sp. GBAus27b]
MEELRKDGLHFVTCRQCCTTPWRNVVEERMLDPLRALPLCQKIEAITGYQPNTSTRATQTESSFLPSTLTQDSPRTSTTQGQLKRAATTVTSTRKVHYAAMESRQASAQLTRLCTAHLTAPLP